MVIYGKKKILTVPHTFEPLNLVYQQAVDFPLVFPIIRWKGRGEGVIGWKCMLQWQLEPPTSESDRPQFLLPRCTSIQLSDNNIPVSHRLAHCSQQADNYMSTESYATASSDSWFSVNMVRAQEWCNSITILQGPSSITKRDTLEIYY